MTDQSAIQSVLECARNAGLETVEKRSPYDEEERAIHLLKLPAGKGERLVVVNTDNAEILANLSLESIELLEEYDGYVDVSAGIIEALLAPREQVGIALIERRLGFKRSTSFASALAEDDEDDDHILACEGPEGVCLEISPSSDTVSALIERNPSRRKQLSLKITGINKLDYAKALTVLETVSNSLFFQIELERGVTLSLRKAYRRPTRPIFGRPKSDENGGISIKYPTHEYDKAPISLYWYARSARRMPLLQFLAFYQVVEFYFPTFAALEAVRTARKVLKNPSFRQERDADMTRLVTSIVGNGRVGGSEREQFKATIYEVLSLAEVTDFFSENPDVSDVLARKQKGITDKTINLKRQGHDHRPEIAELLYDIRCRIVHTKNEASSSKAEMILPFSDAESGLWASIELMQFVAKNSLIRSGTSMASF